MISKRMVQFALLGIGMVAISVSCASTTQPQGVIVQAPEKTLEIALSPTPETTPEPTSLEETKEPIEKTPEPEPATLGKQGTIYIANTNVDYPIMLAENNEYYLRLDENGQRNRGRGSIYADYRNADPAERRNIVLYGHNLKDGSMFTTLHKFENKSFFDNNSIMDVELFGRKSQYEIVYSGIVDIREYYHIQTIFPSEEDFADYYIEGAKHAQFVRAGYRPELGDEMITLSTCVSHSIKDADEKRMIVVGRRIREPGEEPTTDLPLTRADAGEIQEEKLVIPGEA